MSTKFTITEDLLNEIAEGILQDISKQRKYWFVRSNSGREYYSFKNGGYIAIDYPYVSLDSIDLEHKTASRVKAIIADKEGFKASSTSGKAQITKYYNTLHLFKYSMNIGDVVVVPSSGSNIFLFGVITSESYQIDVNESEYFAKRRKVDWFQEEYAWKLDPKLLQISFSRHPISNINDYGYLIDKNQSNLFSKGDAGHIVLNVTEKGDVGLNELFGSLNTLKSLADEFAKENGISSERFSVKTRVQSPGDIELYSKALHDIVLYAAMIAAVFGVNITYNRGKTHLKLKTDGLIGIIKGFIDSNKSRKDKVEEVKDGLNQSGFDPQELVSSKKLKKDTKKTKTKKKR